MKNTAKFGLLLGALVTTTVFASAMPPEKPSHPHSYFTNDTTFPVSWSVHGHDGDAVGLDNHPANPVPAGASNVDFHYYVAFTAYGTETVTWDNKYSCVFGVSYGGVGNVVTPSSDPNYVCRGGKNYGVFPVSQ